MNELPSQVIEDLVEDPKDDGTYQLNIEGDDLQRLWDAVDALEKGLPR